VVRIGATDSAVQLDHQNATSHGNDGRIAEVIKPTMLQACTKCLKRKRR